jgi:hypothetical protein
MLPLSHFKRLLCSAPNFRCNVSYMLVFIFTFVLTVMNKPTSIAQKLRPLIVVFLFLSFITSSLNLSTVYREITGYSISKKVHSYNKADTEIPFEEKEKEVEKAEDRHESQLFLTYFIRATALHPLVELQTYHSVFLADISPQFLSVPLYLSKKSLLI